jgi:hypothetical protein
MIPEKECESPDARGGLAGALVRDCSEAGASSLHLLALAVDLVRLAGSGNIVKGR